MFWLIDSCQNSVSADQYRLTASRAQVSTHWVRVFFWRYPLTSCYFSNDRRLKSFFFLKCIWNKSCSWAALLKNDVDFELTSDAKIQPAFTFTCREGNRFWLFSLSRVDHAPRPIFMFWLVKIGQVSSCGKFMQRLVTCLLIAGADRVLWHLVMF